MSVEFVILGQHSILDSLSGMHMQAARVCITDIDLSNVSKMSIRCTYRTLYMKP